MIRIAIIQFPGSNCERETTLAVRRAGMQPESVFWNIAPEKLAEYAGFILVGGFSYEDRSRAGIIAAMDPIMQVIRTQADSGKPVLGICNGAQILVETGLVPGLSGSETALALTDNRRIQNDRVIGTGFYNAWIHMRVADTEPLTAFTKRLSSRDILRMPVAHAGGRFVIPPVLLAEMHHQGLSVFQYCDANGEINPAFPINPNGSVDNIAAISNRAGNVLAMMPHPERTPLGDPIFQSMRDYITKGHVQHVRPLRYLARPEKKELYALPAGYSECIIALQVTDNHALSVENVFRHQGIPVRIRRYAHWQIACDSPEVLQQVCDSGFLFNPRKERILTEEHLSPKATHLLVQPKEDLSGKNKWQQIQRCFPMTGLHDMRQGVLWAIETDPEYLDTVMASPLFYNPYSHDGWLYANQNSCSVD